MCLAAASSESVALCCDNSFKTSNWMEVPVGKPEAAFNKTGPALVWITVTFGDGLPVITPLRL